MHRVCGVYPYSLKRIVAVCTESVISLLSGQGRFSLQGVCGVYPYSLKRIGAVCPKSVISLLSGQGRFSLSVWTESVTG